MLVLICFGYYGRILIWGLCEWCAGFFFLGKKERDTCSHWWLNWFSFLVYILCAAFVLLWRLLCFNREFFFFLSSWDLCEVKECWIMLFWKGREVLIIRVCFIRGFCFFFRFFPGIGISPFWVSYYLVFCSCLYSLCLL